MEKLSLDEILAIGSQDELGPLLDETALKMSRHIGTKARRAELSDSGKQFIKEVYDELGLSFAGLYIDGVYDINYETKDGEPVFGRTVQLDPMWYKIQHAGLDQNRLPNRLITPLRFRDSDCYGLAVFDKTSFSNRDVMIIRDCIFDFANHINNIGEKKLLRRQAITDELTGIYNRRKLNESYTNFIREWKDHSREFGLIFIDLDYFKQINTRYGHPYADYVLATAAGIMQGCVRSGDVLARYGGEEFVALMPGASAEQTEEIARRISDSIRAYRFKDLDKKKAQEVTISVGCVSSSEPNLESDDLMAIADKRMLAAKDYGRDFVVSNLPIDIHTGIANIPKFFEHLDTKLKLCNRPINPGSQVPSLAVMIFDIVGFSNVIQECGNVVAWDMFKDVALWFFGERHNFDYVARAYNRDQMVVALSGEGQSSALYEKVCGMALDYKKKADNIRLKANNTMINLSFAVGGIIYDPDKSAYDLITHPDELFTIAENITKRACDDEKRIIIEYYKP